MPWHGTRAPTSYLPTSIQNFDGAREANVTVPGASRKPTIIYASQLSGHAGRCRRRALPTISFPRCMFALPRTSRGLSILRIHSLLQKFDKTPKMAALTLQTSISCRPACGLPPSAWGGFDSLPSSLPTMLVVATRLHAAILEWRAEGGRKPNRRSAKPNEWTDRRKRRMFVRSFGQLAPSDIFYGLRSFVEQKW